MIALLQLLTVALVELSPIDQSLALGVGDGRIHRCKLQDSSEATSKFDIILLKAASWVAPRRLAWYRIL